MRGTTFTLRHLPGRKNILADLLSRKDQIIHSEWTLSQGTLTWLWHQCPKQKLATFVAGFHHQWDRYWSPVPDPASIGTDTMSQPWNKEPLYVGFLSPN